VFKPFVAAWALERLNLDTRTTRECSAAMNPGGRGPGYKGVHCHETANGHGRVDLERALHVSCNSYFAWLGEQYDQAGLAEMADEFGFGKPSGVRSLAGPNRGGILEHTVPDLFRGQRPLLGRNLLEAGNGLSVVEATPMQVARAMAGLATGKLPTLRLVSRIGDVELARDARDLTISPQTLAQVRHALIGVCADSEGSAHSALSMEQLGFAMAAKTGSADVTSVAGDDNRVIKHTWVAGWFPAEKPVGILVVFVHRTTATSSHSAVWLARQFLKRPAVAAWIAEAVSAR
jgi:cell division protein FtsI/penicillin-binding protein 2